MSVSSLGYITITAMDLPAWREFGSNVLGLMLNEALSDANNLYFRMDDHPSRLHIKSGSEDKLAAVGWEYDNAEAFATAISAIEAAGVSVSRGSSEDAAARCVTEFASCSDLAGNPIEIYHSRTQLNDDFSSPLDLRCFITGEMGMAMWYCRHLIWIKHTIFIHP